MAQQPQLLAPASVLRGEGHELRKGMPDGSCPTCAFVERAPILPTTVPGHATSLRKAHYVHAVCAAEDYLEEFPVGIQNWSAQLFLFLHVEGIAQETLPVAEHLQRDRSVTSREWSQSTRRGLVLVQVTNLHPACNWQASPKANLTQPKSSTTFAVAFLEVQFLWCLWLWPAKLALAFPLVACSKTTQSVGHIEMSSCSSWDAQQLCERLGRRALCR